MQDVDVIKTRERRGVKLVRERGVGVEPFREGRGRESEALQRRKREGGESEARQRRKREGGKVKPFREGRGGREGK